MLRCTKPPIVEYLKNFPVDNIKKSMPDDYYMFNRKLESVRNDINDNSNSLVIILGIISVILIFFLVR